MSAVEFLYLSQEEVIAAGGLDMAAAMADVEAALRAHHVGDDRLPSKVVLDLGENHINLGEPPLDVEEKRCGHQFAGQNDHR